MKNMNQLLVITQDNDRTKYIVRLILEQMLGLEVTFTSNYGNINQAQTPALIYHDTPHKNGVTPFIKAYGLLKDSGVSEQKTEPFQYENTLGLFPTDVSQSIFPFDIFSAAFYLVTRYEEYLSKDRDKHNRFRPEESVLFRENFLQKPVVNQYAALLREKLAAYYPQLTFPEKPFKAISTIDVDTAYACRGKSAMSNMGKITRDLINGRFDAAKNRFLINQGRLQDPFDTYDYLEKLHEQYSTELIYFFLLSKGSKNDRNIDPESPELKELLSKKARKFRIGIHPSYISHKKYETLKSELQTYKKITGEKVRLSRQHFLKFELPYTYRNLLRFGIKEDYSMGYASQPGFRAGIAWPFKFYDLLSEQETGLTVFPTTYMDGTLKEYLKLSPEEAIKKIDQLSEEVARYGGYFISLWHNHTVSNHYDWENWRSVFEHSLQVMHKNHQQSLSTTQEY